MLILLKNSAKVLMPSWTSRAFYVRFVACDLKVINLKFKSWFLHFLNALLLHKIDCCTEKLGVSNIYQRNHAHMDSANELSCCHGNYTTGWSSHGNTESVPTESRGHRSSCLHLSIWVKINLFYNLLNEN